MLNLGLMKIRLVSASDLFFLPSADATLIPVHRTGFSGAVLINCFCEEWVDEDLKKFEGLSKKGSKNE
jgi:hypothetical protein